MGGRSVETRYPRVVSYAHPAVRVRHLPVTTCRRAGSRGHLRSDASSRSRASGSSTRRSRPQSSSEPAGHFCPVARHLRGDARITRRSSRRKPSSRSVNGRTQVSGTTPELFFCRDFQGYAWCVRKGDYVNVGLGRRGNLGFRDHVKGSSRFSRDGGSSPISPTLAGTGMLTSVRVGATPRDQARRILLVGDAAGLAYPESGEGIRPAIESGRLAAETLIAADGRCERRISSPMHRRCSVCTRRPRKPRPSANRLGCRRPRATRLARFHTAHRPRSLVSANDVKTCQLPRTNSEATSNAWELEVGMFGIWGSALTVGLSLNFRSVLASTLSMDESLRVRIGKSARGRISRLLAYCSRICAVQPDMRLTAKTGV